MAEHSSEDVQGHYQLKEMIFCFVTPYMLRAAVLLKIPQMLKSGPLTLEQISSKITHAKSHDILHRILKYLAFKKVFDETTGPDGQVYYGLNSVSKWLEEEAQMVLLCTHPHPHTAFQHIEKDVLDGGHAYEKTHGVHIWEGNDPEYLQLLNEAMLSWSRVTIALVLENYDGFKEAKKLVDVGGGLGMCLEKIIQKYPSVEGINLEIPPTVAAAPKIPGVTHVAGDAYKSVPNGDTVMIKSLFINIGDEASELVLANAWKALPNGGKLVLIEVIHNKDSSFESVMDVLMLGFTNGGRARSEEEFKALLAKTGFTNVSVKKIPAPESVIEAFKTS